MKAAGELRVNYDPLAGDLCFNQIINEEQGKKMGIMNSTLFTEENMRKLEANPYVQYVSKTNITSYTAAFNLAAIRAEEDGLVTKPR